MPAPLMQVIDLTKIYGGGLFNKNRTVALEHFDITIPGDPPRITTIAGESGSGKTTLANIALGFVTPTTGQVLVEGQDIAAMDKTEWFNVRRNVQGIFQDPYGTFNPFYRVDAVFSMLIKKFALASSATEARSITENALEIVGLRPDEILGKFPHQLSGGQRQRIMVARAFLLKPRLIVADEPVSMIDASLQVRILDIFMRLKEEFGISFLYITHDLSTAYQISDDIYVLYQGSLMERGDVTKVIQHPQHPYTQLLVDSIPVPDPDIRWTGAGADADQTTATVTVTGKGCKFYDRCPHRMEMCLREAPPIYVVDEEQYAACYLYRDKPVFERTRGQ